MKLYLICYFMCRIIEMHPWRFSRVQSYILSTYLFTWGYQGFFQSGVKHWWYSPWGGHASPLSSHIPIWRFNCRKLNKSEKCFPHLCTWLWCVTMRRWPCHSECLRFLPGWSITTQFSRTDGNSKARFWGENLVKSQSIKCWLMLPSEGLMGISGNSCNELSSYLPG